jgi:hypothetical protein
MNIQDNKRRTTVPNPNHGTKNKTKNVKEERTEKKKQCGERQKRTSKKHSMKGETMQKDSKKACRRGKQNFQGKQLMFLFLGVG